MVAISIVITTHNLGYYLDECMVGLQRQSFQNFDVIIVDDASTDETREIIEKWCTKDTSKIKNIMIDENLGAPGLVRNVALDSGLIDGEYVLFLDGDDICDNRMLEIMYRNAKLQDVSAVEGHADIIICAYDRIDEISGKVLATEMKGFPNKIEVSNSKDLLAFINTASWNKLWKRDVIKDLRYSDFKTGEEVIFTHRAYRKSSLIVFVDDNLIHYRVRTNSVISQTSEETIWLFANALLSETSNDNTEYRKVMELVVYLHIGLSMGLRASNNPEIILHDYIQKTRKWFNDEYGWFRENRYFKFGSLIKHGIKGFAIWVSYHMYRANIFGIALYIYRRMNLNIKF